MIEKEEEINLQKETMMILKEEEYKYKRVRFLSIQ